MLNGVAYVGGHFTHYCGPVIGSDSCTTVARDHLLAVDATTGSLEGWRPSANGILGVFALAAGDQTLEAGGDFTKIGGVAQQGFAELPLISDPSVTDSAGGQPTTAPSVTVTASGSTDPAPGFVGYRYQISTNAGTSWTGYYHKATAKITALGTTMVRFQAYDACGNTSDFVTDTVTIQ